MVYHVYHVKDGKMRGRERAPEADCRTPFLKEPHGMTLGRSGTDGLDGSVSNMATTFFWTVVWEGKSGIVPMLPASIPLWVASKGNQTETAPYEETLF